LVSFLCEHFCVVSLSKHCIPKAGILINENHIKQASKQTMSHGSTETNQKPFVTVTATPGPRAPFGETISFSIYPGGCVLLSGRSGIGKSSVASFVAGLQPSLGHLDVDATCDWDESIPTLQHCGVLFQQTTLLDELSVAGNLAVALRGRKDHDENEETMSRRDTTMTTTVLHQRIKQYLEQVGLDYARDAAKRPSELSGGMARRASLALQMAQQKRVIVLDEPFAGLDYEAAVSVAKELVHLRETVGTSLILISHEPDLAAMVMDPKRTKHNTKVLFSEPRQRHSDTIKQNGGYQVPSLHGITFLDRLVDKILDYLLWSLPLILLAFLASGLAISMLSADLLQRLDVTTSVLDLVDKEVKPLIKMLTGEEPSTFMMMGVNFKVRSMLNTSLPPAKAAIYAIGMAKLFVLELGPLLTALLLCGRIGGAYAGAISTLQATMQSQLLQTLGQSPRMWSLAPALVAALVAGPILTSCGTFLALAIGGRVGLAYDIDTTNYWEKVRETTFPDFVVDWPLSTNNDHDNDGLSIAVFYALVDILTYPPIFHVVKAETFIAIIVGTAEVCARKSLTPRGVPKVITRAVVIAGILVILADWGFSQLWLVRR
jgi:ABC-type multidrug transport system ATPase subunit/ABC-type transporter Mla maintaining outer membrane lipid asymmetry permease subunit MlaE